VVEFYQEIQEVDGGNIRCVPIASTVLEGVQCFNGEAVQVAANLSPLLGKNPFYSAAQDGHVVRNLDDEDLFIRNIVRPFTPMDYSANEATGCFAGGVLQYL
jgi:hypothetical protein